MFRCFDASLFRRNCGTKQVVSLWRSYFCFDRKSGIVSGRTTWQNSNFIFSDSLELSESEKMYYDEICTYIAVQQNLNPKRKFCIWPLWLFIIWSHLFWFFESNLNAETENKMNLKNMVQILPDFLPFQSMHNERQATFCRPICSLFPDERTSFEFLH